MTHNSNHPDGDRIATFGGFLLLVILCIVGMCTSSCGPSYHLRRAEQHLKKAELKGANVRTDTVYKLDTVYVPVLGIETDTIFQSVPGDTVRIEKERLKITYVELRGDSVYIQGECEADTVIQVRNIPVSVTKEITSGYSLWDLVVLAVFCFAVGYIFGMFRKRKSLG